MQDVTEPNTASTRPGRERVPAHIMHCKKLSICAQSHIVRLRVNKRLASDRSTVDPYECDSDARRSTPTPRNRVKRHPSPKIGAALASNFCSLPSGFMLLSPTSTHGFLAAMMNCSSSRSAWFQPLPAGYAHRPSHLQVQQRAGLFALAHTNERVRSKLGDTQTRIEDNRNDFVALRESHPIEPYA